MRILSLTLLISISTMLLYSQNKPAGGTAAPANTTWEFIVYSENNPSNKVVSVNAQLVPGTNAYGIDNQGNMNLITQFNSTVTTGWDSPKSQTNYGDPYIPWGLIEFTIYVDGGNIGSFKVDFRDDRWSTEVSIYPSHDTELIVDVLNGTYRLSHSNSTGESTSWPITAGQNIQYMGNLECSISFYFSSRCS